MKRYLRITALLMALTLLLSVCGCANDADALDRVERKGRIVFGIAPDSMPLSGGTQEQPAGISAALGNEIAARLDVEAEYIFITNENAVQYINDGIIDCYINLAEPDLHTAAQLRMVDSLFEWRQVAVVPSWSRASQLVDLTGERLCVVSGSDANAALDAAEVFKGSMRAVEYCEDHAQVMDKLLGKACAVGIVDEMQFMSFAGEQRSSFVVIDEPLASSSYVLAFAYSNTTLAERVQSIYDDMKADGTLDEVRAQFIG